MEKEKIEGENTERENVIMEKTQEREERVMEKTHTVTSIKRN